MSESKQHVLFLDRDGTINIDLGSTYLNYPKDARLIQGAGRALARARHLGFKTAIITNQAGIAKGITPPENLPLIHKELERLIAEEGNIQQFQFDDIQVCPHHPQEGCECRKPKTLMLQQAMKNLNANLITSFFIGDKLIDLECGERMGMKSILVRTGHGLETEAGLKASPTLVPFGIVDSLEEAIAWIERHFHRFK